MTLRIYEQNRFNVENKKEIKKIKFKSKEKLESWLKENEFVNISKEIYWKIEKDKMLEAVLE